MVVCPTSPSRYLDISSLSKKLFTILIWKGLANTPVVGPVVKEKLAMLPGMKENRVNTTIKMDCAKVVDTVDIEDMGDKGVFCRLIFVILSWWFIYVYL